MTRRRRIALIVAGSLAGLVLVVVLAAIVVVQTGWFRNTVRDKLISAVEEGTGGKAEVGSFSFDWRHLRAQVRNFVIHGLEPRDAAPLFRANLVQVDLKLTSPFKGGIDIAGLLVDTPQANVMVFPDGRTNIPAPKIKKKSDKSGLETVVDLAVGKFALLNGALTFAERKSNFNATGRNLRAHLDYRPVNPAYTGTVEMSPLYLQSGNNPLEVNVKLPVTLETDKITLTDARIAAPQSQIVINGAVEHLAAPRASGRVQARIALDEARRAAGLNLPLDTQRGPGTLTADISARSTEDRIDIQNARIDIGSSSIEAAGPLQNSGNPASMRFNATLAMGELGRLFRVSARPEGTVKIGGNATLRNASDYLVTANVDGHGLSFGQGGTRLTGVGLDSAVSVNPHRIELAGIRIAALGGSFTGSAGLEEMRQFRVTGNLRNFDIQEVARAVMPRRLGYSGIVSGPIRAEGDIHAPAGTTANAALSIAPGQRGVPVSGRLNVDYAGRNDTLVISRSYLALPSSRVDISGSLNRELQVRLASRNLNDFLPAVAAASGNPPRELPVTLNRGSANLDATVTGTLSAPRISAHAALTNFAVEGRPFDRFTADVDAAETGVAVKDALLERGSLHAQISASAGLRNWSPEPRQPLTADASIRNADVRDVLALAGKSEVDVTGALTAGAHISGTIGDPRGNATVDVANGAVYGEPFQQFAMRANLSDRSIDVPSLQLVAGASRIDANASYQHPPNQLNQGTVRVHVASNQVALEQFQQLVKDRPGLGGRVSLVADAAGVVRPAGNTSEFQLTALNTNASARGLQMEGRRLGDLTATANTSGSTVQYAVNSDFAGSTIRVNGQSLLTGDHQTTATAAISNLPIDRVLVVAGRRDLPVSGIIGLNAQLAGTLQDPRASGTASIANGSAWQEKFDRIQAAVAYDNRTIDVQSLRVAAGPSELDLSARLVHSPKSLQDGTVQFKVRSNRLQLARFSHVQQFKPGLSGNVQLSADGAATLRENATPGVLFSTLNANLAATGLAVNGEPVGGLTASAETRGAELAFNLKSDFAHSDIQGSGRMQLTGAYPMDAKITFNRVTYSGLQGWIGTAVRRPFDASVDGAASVSGPITRPEALEGRLQLSKLEAHSVATGAGAPPRTNMELHNAAPIVVELQRSIVTVRSAHITGPFTELNLTGSAPIQGAQPMNLRADGKIRLDVLQAFSSSIYSSGDVVLNAAVTGTAAKPVVDGRLQLQNASFNMADMPNGITDANGAIQFNGTEAVIQNVTGKTGGGAITLAGTVGYGGPEMVFRLNARADEVRVLYPSTVATQANARLSLTGNTTRSLLSGTVTILDVGLYSHSDVGSMLTSVATPPSSPSSDTGPLSGMTFDVRIETAPDVQFRTTLTQNLQAEAKLTLRGTPAHPGMLGRVNVTQGDVVFFGYKYAIDRGSISFYNPNKINPILNVDLETDAKGVAVSLSVSGPMDRLKLTYHSDPPLQFNEIVALLATGKVPTSDPVLAAQQPPAPQQSFEQMGASTLLGQAVANPVAGRLQRLFGVSKLKIDPAIIGADNTPQARLTIEQQISRQITFTYIQDVTQSNPQIIRIEWAFDPAWTAIAARQSNGEFGLDFFYRKRFW